MHQNKTTVKIAADLACYWAAHSTVVNHSKVEFYYFDYSYFWVKTRNLRKMYGLFMHCLTEIRKNSWFYRENWLYRALFEVVYSHRLSINRTGLDCKFSMCSTYTIALRIDYILKNCTAFLALSNGAQQYAAGSQQNRDYFLFCPL